MTSSFFIQIIYSYYNFNACYSLFAFLQCFLCREFNQNPNLWEKKKKKKRKEKNTRQKKKKNTHMHKTVFMWFGNLPTSTELQRFHYYQRKVQSAATVFLSLKNMATTPQKTLITKVGFYIQNGPKFFFAYRPKPPLHGLSLRKSPIKKPHNIIRIKSGR